MNKIAGGCLAVGAGNANRAKLLRRIAIKRAGEIGQRAQYIAYYYIRKRCWCIRRKYLFERWPQRRNRASPRRILQVRASIGMRTRHSDKERARCYLARIIGQVANLLRLLDCVLRLNWLLL